MDKKQINNLKAKIIDYLVKNACTSISARTQKEIKKENICVDDEKLIDDKVKLVLSWQMPDGYFGTRLHTPPSNSKVWAHEACVRYLLEKGFSANFKPLKKSLDVLLLDGWEKEFIGSKAGQAFDGSRGIPASLFSQAGRHEHDFMQNYVEKSLFPFEIVAKADGYSDIAVPYKNKHIYQKGKWLPEVYAFRTLAYTFSWRTKNNKDMLSKAYNNLYKWLPFPQTYIKFGSQLVAPAGHVQLPLNNDFDESIGFPWFEFYELSARMGMLTKKSPFYKHFQNLFEKALETEGNIFMNINKKGFVNWSSYSGLALEENWSKKQYKINDLLFRCCLIDSIINFTE
jgi:hypothetical protein